MYFFVKTENPRPTFHLDMTPQEREVMQKHIAYWTEKASRGIAVVFGPVMDPQGVYGMAVCEVVDQAQMRELLAHDPANGLLIYVLTPMARAVVGTPAQK